MPGYRGVTHLTHEELNDLKKYYFLREGLKDKFNSPDEIPDDFIYSYYRDTLFVNED